MSIEPQDGFHSVTRQGREIRNPEKREAAACKLWESFDHRLRAMIAASIAPRFRGNVPEEDVAQEAFRSLFSELEAGRVEFEDREELFALLSDIAKKKRVSHVRREAAEKRGAGAIQQCNGEELNRGVKPIPSDEDRRDYVQPVPLPENPKVEPESYYDLNPLQLKLKDMEPMVQLLGREAFECLPPELRRVLELYMQRYAREEIANDLGITKRAVDRKIARIREKWSQLTDRFEEPSASPDDSR